MPLALFRGQFPPHEAAGVLVHVTTGGLRVSSVDVWAGTSITTPLVSFRCGAAPV